MRNGIEFLMEELKKSNTKQPQLQQQPPQLQRQHQDQEGLSDMDTSSDNSQSSPSGEDKIFTKWGGR